jgi:hypothetical protein
MNNQDQTEDWWYKTLWSTWALIEAANDSSARVRFIRVISDTGAGGEEFGELSFTSAESAVDALRRNEFSRYRDDKVMQDRSDLFPLPLPPFSHVERPNLLCSIFWTDIPVSETSILKKISAMLKKYEPRFELEGAFVPGVRGRADPNFTAAIEKRFPRFSLEATMAEMRSTTDDDGAEADPRFNWRVTVRHGGNYIHIMALNQSLSRFACCLQRSGQFEAGAGAYRRYETGTLAEIDPVLDDIYAKLLKPEDEQRRQQDQTDQAVDRAVAKERERSERELTLNNTRWWVLIIFIILVAISLLF